ncbi:hypothetical protein T06_11139 [Trichinella sp. T6]|nr:hypothetical protein T06_11139 [Trichinella sp. T6]
MLVEDTSESGRSATEVQRDGTDEVLDVDSRRANCCIQLVSKSLIHGQEPKLRHDSGRYHRPSSGAGKRFKTFIECDSALSFPRVSYMSNE